MKQILPTSPAIDYDFTDEQLTAQAGLTFLMATAQRLRLIRLLKLFLPAKRRQRGASDQENLWSLIATLASGDGTLQDQDRLRENRANRTLLGLRHVAGSRRMGEWLSRLTRRHADSLRGLATGLARVIAPVIIRAEIAKRGYLPLFIDGTAIEVQGQRFEGAKTIYTKQRALWLYAVFLGRLQISSRLCAAVSDAAGNWRQQLKRDVVPLIPQGQSVWVAVDNAYFRRQFVTYMTDLGWDWSISVTNDSVKANILDLLELDTCWTPFGDEDQADICDTYYQPSRWPETYRCIVVRRWQQTEHERELFPSYTIIMTSSDRLSASKVVKRHTKKQGFENGFKGPLREMNLHHPPTASLAGNQVYYLCGLMAQMLLTYMQYQLLPDSAREVSLRPLIRDLMRSVAKLTRSGRRYCLKFAKDQLRLDWLLQAMDRVDAWRLKAPT